MQNITNIIKSLVIAALLVALASQIAIAEANAETLETCVYIDAESISAESVKDLQDNYAYFSLAGDDGEYIYSPQCADSAEFVSELPDEARFSFYDKFELPQASEGYTWSEDLTLVANSFYSNYKGGESPSSHSQKSATVTSDTVAQAPKASDSSAMKKAKELAAKAKDRKSNATTRNATTKSPSDSSKTSTKSSESKNTAKSPSKSSESSKSCTAEDGSTIENCQDYYSPAPKTSDDGWLVLVWDKGTTNKCSVFTNDRSEADSVASKYQSSGKAAAVVHYTKSLATKSPSC